jgi:hypothetical protein
MPSHSAETLCLSPFNVQAYHVQQSVKFPFIREGLHIG